MNYILLLIAALTIPLSAQAACVSPDGEAGWQVYNSTHNVMQYCDGTKWISMAGGGGGGLSIDCDPGQVVGSDGDNFVCATDAVFSGTVQAAAPTANGHLATKAYVDTAVASAGGGGGASCYYVLTPGACGSGFVAMPGNMAFYSGGQARICCSSGGSSGDTTPDIFDFPDTPELAANAAHTWTAIQLAGFDSASVILDDYPGLEYRICSDSACTNVIKNWKTTPDIVSGGQYLQLRLTATLGSRRVVTITVGDMSDTVSVNKPWTVFVTSGTWNGNLGGVSGADAKCQAAASSAGLSGSYRAWISDANVASAPVFRFENKTTATAFYLVTGVKVVDSWADLVDGTLDTAINRTETGGATGGGGDRVWTGTGSNGQRATSNPASICDDWGSSGSGNETNYGDTSRTDNQWAWGYMHRACNLLSRLYCFQTKVD